MQPIIQSIDLISIDANIRNGRPCIVGTSIEVSAIVIAKILQDLDPDEIAANYELSLSQVYAALAYYYENKQAIDIAIAERRQLAQKMREERIGSRYPLLLGDWVKKLELICFVYSSAELENHVEYL